MKGFLHSDTCWKGRNSNHSQDLLRLQPWVWFCAVFLKFYSFHLIPMLIPPHSCSQEKTEKRRKVKPTPLQKQGIVLVWISCLTSGGFTDNW